MFKSAAIAITCLGLTTLYGCAAETIDPAAMKEVSRGNILAPVLTVPRPGTGHVVLVRTPGALGSRCDAVAQLSFHSVPGGRIVDVAKIWAYERLDMYPDPGAYRLNVYTMLCGGTPGDVDFELKPGEELAFRVITTPFGITLKPLPLSTD